MSYFAWGTLLGYGVAKINASPRETSVAVLAGLLIFVIIGGAFVLSHMSREALQSIIVMRTWFKPGIKGCMYYGLTVALIVGIAVVVIGYGAPFMAHQVLSSIYS